jgi:hypothetical protein
MQKRDCRSGLEAPGRWVAVDGGDRMKAQDEINAIPPCDPQMSEIANHQKM